ncbi:hypothetical protein V8B97DRAFT_1870111 [Scleroderma yunnanense]
MLTEANGILPLRADLPPNNSLSSTEAALQSLYNRAARAFLHHDVVLAETLVASAFNILQPPVIPAPDTLDCHRRKWDILRITHETTVYTGPSDRGSLPPALRETLLLSPQSFVVTAHTRSLSLFTPSSLPRKPTSAFLPHQVLITLMASSLKVNCPAIGREMAEDWLANRGQYDHVQSTGEAYEKVIELYCLGVLPRLEEWEYAKEFLQYEVELPHGKRTEFQRNILSLQECACRGQSAQSPTPTPSTPTPSLRSPSPTPSASSSNSSLSTLSTRTITPLTHLSGPSQPRRGSLTSISSAATDATVKRSPSRQPQKVRTPTPRASPSSSLARKPRMGTAITETTESPSTLALIRASVCRYLRANRLTTLSILFLLLPLLSFLIRLRRVRGSGASASTTDQVKRRLLDSRSDSFLRRMWEEMVRAIVDTVRMGGSGLV